MTILALRRVTLAGLAQDRKVMLSGLQRMGCLHLIPLRPKLAADPDRTPSAPAEEAYKALRWISDVAEKRQQVKDKETFDFDAVVRLALGNKQRLREAEDEKAFLQRRIHELTPWGDFTLPDSAYSGGYLYWFYQLPLHERGRLAKLELPWQEVHRDNRFTYVVVIAREEPDAGLLPVPRTHTGAVSLSQLHARLNETEVQLEDLHAEHTALSRWIFLLSQNLAHAEDRSALVEADQGIWLQHGVCLVQGWVAERELPLLQEFATELGLALTAEKPLPEERPPTLLENPSPVDGGQDLVSFYQTPNYHEWDPSRIVFFSFALFFAMILADAGYAVILGLILARYWKRMEKSAEGRRFRILSVVVLAASFLYGVLVGSYFGIEPSPGTLVARLKLLELNDFDSMMRLSIAIGCLHLLMANLVVALRLRPFPHNARPIGWSLALTGGFAAYLGSTEDMQGLITTGYLLLSLGLLLVMLFASNRRVSDWKSALLRLLDGLAGLAQVTKMFGDVLSYLRLFALGLASASLALTFNDLAMQVKAALPGPGLLLAILILFLGHSINLGLGIISGFVHGLRLNFIEFFNWGMSDEGYPFRAFAKKEIEP
ncbi:V-type ATP synthase subunit I [bacterium endosymbiont of Escarpia laminata]|nr:MAG: V-type ATP synthase subunit I [bacterium endosymbiont of Escarpia laminata]